MAHPQSKKLSWTDSVNSRFQLLAQLTLDTMKVAFSLADGLKDRTTRLAALEMLLLRGKPITEEAYKAALTEVEVGRQVDKALDPELQKMQAELERSVSELKDAMGERDRSKPKTRKREKKKGGK
jgi:hypothetical protein